MEELTREQKLEIINDVVRQLKHQISDVKGDDARSEFLRHILGTAIVVVIVAPL